jgi:hypothetical protein
LNLGATQINEARQILSASASVAIERDRFVPQGNLSDGPPADPSIYLYQTQA